MDRRRAIAPRSHQVQVPSYRIPGQIQVHDLPRLPLRQKPAVGAGQVTVARGDQAQKERSDETPSRLGRRQAPGLQPSDQLAQLARPTIPSPGQDGAKTPDRHPVDQRGKTVKWGIDETTPMPVQVCGRHPLAVCALFAKHMGVTKELP